MLLKRLETDRSLAAFAGQFVPLRINSSGSPEWTAWSKRYRHEGKTIPILYVVRADGKQLYGRSGMLSGSALPTMLLATLNQSGRRFSDEEVRLLETLVPKAKEAYEQGRSAQAALTFAQLKKLGKPGELNSFATAGVDADELAKKIIEETTEKISAAEQSLQDSESAFKSLAYLAEVKDAYGAFGDLPAAATRALKSIKGDKELQTMLAQAESLQRARRYAMAESAAVKRKAPSAYERLIQRYPDTEAAKVAADELKALSETPAATTAKKPSNDTKEPTTDNKKKPAESYRQWSDVSGRFKVTAKLVAVKEGEIILENKAGKRIPVPLKRLSAADRKYVLSKWDDQ